MSFLDRIAECNRHDPARYAPFFIGAAAVGQVRRDRIEALAGEPDLIAALDGAACLSPRLTDAAARTAALARIVRRAAARGLCHPWRGEPFPVGVRFGDRICEIDRAGAELFGIATWGVHLNGYVETAEGLSLWIPRRSPAMLVAPGKLDNMAAGGLPAGVGVVENLAKEAAEEADIPAALAARAIPVGAVTYLRDDEFGLKRGHLFVFDLALPAGFTPRNRDGEVEDFALWPVEKALRRVAGTRDFKFDSAVVLIDFFVRHGLIPPDRADYTEICAGLRASTAITAARAPRPPGGAR